MGLISEALKKYFEETSKEQLDAEWEEIKHLNDIGPDVIEYCQLYRDIPDCLKRKMYATYKISQLIETEYGGMITDEEWADDTVEKYTIQRVYDDTLAYYISFECYEFVAFRTEEQREDFMSKHEDLVRDYYMINKKEENKYD